MNPIIKITEIYLPKFNNAEYTQFLSGVQKLVETATPARLGISEDFFSNFKTNIQKLTDIAKQSKTSDETVNLNELDIKRDNEAVYLLSTIRNDRKAPLADKRSAAISLYNLAKPYIGVQKLPNRQETQVIEGLITDLEKPENAANIAKLGLAEAVATLKETNLQYKILTAERAGNQAIQVLESAKKVRLVTDEEYDEIATRAFAASVATPTEESRNFVSGVNKLIGDTELAYKQRGARKKNDDGSKA